MEPSSLSNEQARGEVRIVVEVGNEHFPPGRTRLDLWPEGNCLVVNRFEQEEVRFEGRIAPQRASRLLDQATSGTFWRRKLGERPGLPDEPRYHLAVYLADAPVYRCTFWRSEYATDREIGVLIEELQAVVREVTDGRAIL
jgi:hypothetical protein